MNLLGSTALNRSPSLTQFLRGAWRRAAFGFAVWSFVISITVFAADESYIVKRGDTVFSIARSYGVSSAVLAERNGLSHNYHLYLGQRLTIPKGQAAGASASQAKRAPEAVVHVKLPRSIQHAIDRAPVRQGRWQYIVIHHSGVDTGKVKAMDQYHREVRHMENGLAYDFVIGNGSGMGDGEIAVGPRWTKQLDGGHLASEAQNKVALGICLVGNFDDHVPSARQLQSLRSLIEALMLRCHLTPSAVKTHQQINIVHTRCPGARFPTAGFLGLIKASPG